MNLDKSQRKLLLTCILLGGISNLLFGVNKQNNAFLPSYVELSTKSAINENLSANAAVYDLSSNWTIEPYHGNISNPPYDFYFKRNLSVNKTFYRKINLQQGDSINFEIKLCLFDCTGYCFYASDPDVYSKTISWSMYSGSSVSSILSDVAPVSGEYVFLIESSQYNCLCDFRANDYATIDYISSNILECVQDTTQVFNTFTCNSSGNVGICIVDDTERVCAYNDNYNGTGTFAWGTEARIKKKFDIRTNKIIVFHTENTGQVTTDLYARCKYPEFWANYFYNYAPDDAISTCPDNGWMAYDYNCYAWAGGCWFTWIDPTCFPEMEYNPNEGNYRLLEYWLEDCGYTTVGATEANSEIDVYRYDTIPEYPKDYSHMSVRSYTNNLSYGYSWESKLGEMARVMHPRYALTGYYANSSPDHRAHGYGIVVKHYKLLSSISYGQNNFVFQNVDFTYDENRFIDERVMKIEKEKKNEFELLYDKCKCQFRENGYSTTDMLKRIDDYKELLDYCNKNVELLYLVYNKVRNGDVVACRLVRDLTLDLNYDVLDSIRLSNINKGKESDSKIIRSLQSSAIAYIKGLLYKGIYNSSEGFELDNTTYSNDEDILKVQITSNKLDIYYMIDDTSKVSLIICDRYGNLIEKPVYNTSVNPGDYHSVVELSKSNNFYVVTLLVNGKIYSKKLLLNN